MTFAIACDEDPEIITGTVTVTDTVTILPDTLVLTPSADAYIMAGDSNRAPYEFGSGDYLRVGQIGSIDAIVRSLIKFDVSSIDENATVLSAKLILTPNLRRG